MFARHVPAPQTPLSRSAAAMSAARMTDASYQALVNAPFPAKKAAAAMSRVCDVELVSTPIRMSQERRTLPEVTVVPSGTATMPVLPLPVARRTDLLFQP